jgi:hypothetical protein
MFHEGIISLLVKVVKSWQVLFITAALIVYFMLVTYVARLYHKPRNPLFGGGGKPKKEKPAAAAAAAKQAVAETSTADDDLGLEQE